MGILRHIIIGGGAMLGLMALGAPASADSAISQQQKVVELYTSQGCSSCPPADAMLGELDALTGVLGLSLHVPYWDYLGWPDKFAQEAHETRQRGYAHALRMRSVYTPQMIFGGRVSVVGSKRAKIQQALDAYPAPRARLHISATPGAPEAQALRVEIAPLAGAAALEDPAYVIIVGFDPEHSVMIDEGENAGRRLTYYNVVRQMTPIARWDGAGGASVDCPRPKGARAAVLVQQGRHGPIIGAARLDP